MKKNVFFLTSTTTQAMKFILVVNKHLAFRRTILTTKLYIIQWVKVDTSRHQVSIIGYIHIAHSEYLHVLVSQCRSYMYEGKYKRSMWRCVVIRSVLFSAMQFVLHFDSDCMKKCYYRKSISDFLSTIDWQDYTTQMRGTLFNTVTLQMEIYLTPGPFLY